MYYLLLCSVLYFHLALYLHNTGQSRVVYPGVVLPSENYPHHTTTTMCVFTIAIPYRLPQYRAGRNIHIYITIHCYYSIWKYNGRQDYVSMTNTIYLKQLNWLRHRSGSPSFNNNGSTKSSGSNWKQFFFAN